MKSKFRPYDILLLSAILTGIVGYLLRGKSALNIHQTDSAFDSWSTLYIWFPVLTLFVLWIIYLLTSSYLTISALKLSHIFLSILLLVIIALSPYILTDQYHGLSGLPRMYLDDGKPSLWKDFSRLNGPGKILLISLILTQVLYLVNLTTGLTRTIRHKNNR